MNREKVIVRAGFAAIIVNLLLAVFKLVVGFISHSLAVTSDAAHGLVDTISGIIVVAGEKLATSEKNQARQARIERASAILIAGIIVIVGVHILVEAILQIVNPEAPDYSAPVLIVLVASVVGKLLLGLYLSKTGKAVSSDSLIASSVETLNDAVLGAAVLISAIIYLIWQVNIEAYVSIVIAAVIMKLGVELILPKKDNSR